MTRQTTEYNQNVWLARCRHADCEEIKIRCPVCKRPGHITTHVMSADGNFYPVKIIIQHSHFLENVDAGRNMFCETEYSESADIQTDIVISWRLNPIARRRLVDEYTRKLSK